MKDEKYTVYKNEDLEKLESNVPPQPLEDAVVIRLQDAFAPPALDAYANSIMLVVEMLKKTEMESDTRIEQLESVADYFRARAEEAWGLIRKLPD